jgi:hypothetical protein
MATTLYYREKGPICYDIILWDRADTIPAELLSTGLTWFWSSALNEEPKDSDGVDDSSRKRDLTLLTPETAALLQNDFKQSDVDDNGRYISLIGTDPGETPLTSKKLELDFERFLASEGPPLRCAIFQDGDCPGAYVFVPHSLVPSMEALFTLWGVFASTIKRTSYKRLNLARLESMWRSILQDFPADQVN